MGKQSFIKRAKVYFDLMLLYKWWLIVPVILVIAVPIYGAFHRDSQAMYSTSVANAALILYPILSIWWTLLYNKETIDAPGREVLYVINRSKLYGVIFNNLVSILLISFVHGLFFQRVYAYPFRFYIKCIMLSVMFNGLVYAVMFFTNSIALAVGSSLLLNVCIMGLGFEIPLIKFHTAYYVMDNSMDYFVAMAYMTIGILSYLLGYYLNKKYTNYN